LGEFLGFSNVQFLGFSNVRGQPHELVLELLTKVLKEVSVPADRKNEKVKTVEYHPDPAD